MNRTVGTDIRVVFLNGSRPVDADDVAELARAVTDVEPHVIAMVETQSEGSSHENLWRRELSGYDVRVLPRGVLFAARRPYRVVGWEPVDRRSAIASFQLQVAGGRLLRIVVADVDGNPWRSRRKEFRVILDALERVQEPALLVGDFNTPRDSVRWNQLERAGFVDAFEAASGGYAPTWPVPLPVMMLDHVRGRHLIFVDFAKIRTDLSDHEMLVVDVAFDPAG